MGIFGGVENDDPESSGGFLKRFRASRASTFVEPTQAAEPRFTKASRPANRPVSFLGRSLAMDDVEDVESSPVLGRAPEETRTPVQDVEPRQERGPLNFEQASVERFTTLPTRVAMPESQTGREAGAQMGEALEEGGVPHSVAQAQKTKASPDAAVVADASPFPLMAATPAAPASVVSAQPSESAAFPNEEDRLFAEKADSLVVVSGRPLLVSAEALPDYKRILTTADDDAALRIPAAARKEFIAVELQPGIAISVATARFCERAQYATFIKDLANNDVFVREEMVATEAVIAAVYAGKNTALSKGVVRESSRAIGNFRDIIEAAHAYGASDVHFEPRDFQGEVEVRFRVNGDLYTFRHMPKAIVRRALFAAYRDLVQSNTNFGNSFQPSAPQSAMIPLVVKTDTVNLRWQSSPLVGGYDVALRLLDGNFKNYSVLLPKDMGYEDSQLAVIDALNYVSGGVTALTGETGSGKTTTLRALSYMLPDRDLKKQYAVNEPSEYPMPWLSDYSIIRRPGETDG